MQCVDLDFSTPNFEQTQLITGTTVIWVGFKNSVKDGNVLSLHCRQCDIQQVFRIVCWRL